MTNRFWTILVVTGVVALAAGVGVGAAIWAGGDHGAAASSMDMDGSAHGSGGMDAALDEQAFLEQMVPHHQSAIEAAQLALEMSERPEIRELAREIITAQEREIAQMQSWHLAWFDEELTSDASGGHMQMDIGELEAGSGDEFDRAFLSMMIPHHASAIMMAESVMTGTARGEVTMIADEIIAAQAEEIGQMQRWRDQWFPRG